MITVLAEILAFAVIAIWSCMFFLFLFTAVNYLSIFLFGYDLRILKKVELPEDIKSLLEDLDKLNSKVEERKRKEQE